MSGPPVFAKQKLPRVSCRELAETRGKRLWYVYILKCSDGSYYTGSTADLNERLKRHNSSSAPEHTRVRRPVELKYFEEFANKDLALKRELQIKSWGIKNKEYLMKNGLGIIRPSSL